MLDNEKYRHVINNILELYKTKDKNCVNFHWEFNNYALLLLYNISGNNEINQIITPLQFKGTKCTNWTILRGLSRIISRNKRYIGLYEITKKIILYQNDSGLIKDDLMVNSFQYHCFSMALLAEVYIYTNIIFFKKRFLRALNFIIPFILSNGDTIYIGRGQEQIFGYGPLIYSLGYAYNITGDIQYKNIQKKVIDYLASFKRDDGSFPLVLRKDEKGFPHKINVNDQKYLGWYNYNNYFDYLPFLGYYLVKSSALYQDEIHEKKQKKNQLNIEKHFNDFLIYKNFNYEAVVSKPGGYLTNDMPIPYICYKSKSTTPCYGGEEYGSNLYSVESIPLPWGIKKIKRSNLLRTGKCFILEAMDKKYNPKRFIGHILKTTNTLQRKNTIKKYYFRNELRYILDNNKLIGESYCIKHIRQFNFLEAEIIIKDKITFKQPLYFEQFYPIHLLFYNLKSNSENNFISCIDDVLLEIVFKYNYSPYISSQNYYCALGKLDCINNKIEDVNFKKGDQLNIEYTIKLNGN